MWYCLLVVLICISSKTYKLNMFCGAVSLPDFFTFLNWIVDGLMIEVWEIFIYDCYWRSLSHVILRHFLPVCNLSFYFFKNIIQNTDILILIKSNLSFCCCWKYYPFSTELHLHLFQNDCVCVDVFLEPLLSFIIYLLFFTITLSWLL